MSEHLQPIYDVWGGNAEAMAADIEELGVTVRQWRNRGDIPSRVWPKIIRAAAAKGASLRLEDFLPPDVKRDLPVHSESPKPEWPIEAESVDSAPLIASPAAEGGHGHPFAPPSSLTCSATSAPPQPLPASQASSTAGQVDAA